MWRPGGSQKLPGEENGTGPNMDVLCSTSNAAAIHLPAKPEHVDFFYRAVCLPVKLSGQAVS